MGLKITLRPHERIIVNGCVIRNGDRRNGLYFETRADIVRESELLDPKDNATPVGQAYFLIQNALMSPELRERITPEIQKRLAQLAACFGAEMRGRVTEAANSVATGDHYKALAALRVVLRYEAELLEMFPAARPIGEMAERDPLPERMRA